MNSRDKILGTIGENQPSFRPLPDLPSSQDGDGCPAGAFMAMLESIGGQAYLVAGYDRVAAILREQHPDAGRVVSVCPQLAAFGFGDASAAGAEGVRDAAGEDGDGDAAVGGPHTLENVDLAVLRAHFGVAENGACWITEDRMLARALPFITQHLALVLRRGDIVPDMHAAYERIAAPEAADGGYGFAAFIAGPSKTADIEQSLVLGAHGPRSMTVFLLDEGISDAGFY